MTAITPTGSNRLHRCTPTVSQESSTQGVRRVLGSACRFWDHSKPVRSHHLPRPVGLLYPGDNVVERSHLDPKCFCTLGRDGDPRLGPTALVSLLNGHEIRLFEHRTCLEKLPAVSLRVSCRNPNSTRRASWATVRVGSAGGRPHRENRRVRSRAAPWHYVQREDEHQAMPAVRFPQSWRCCRCPRGVP